MYPVFVPPGNQNVARVWTWMCKAEIAPAPQRTDTGNATYSQVSNEERKDAATSVRRNKISGHPGVRKESLH